MHEDSGSLENKHGKLEFHIRYLNIHNMFEGY